MEGSDRQAAPSPLVWQGPLDEVEAARRVGPQGDAAFGQHPAQHVVDRPGDGRHGGDAEALEDLRSPRVVDAGDDARDLVGLPGDAGAEDVGVVAACDSGERAGVAWPRPLRGGPGRTRSPTIRWPGQSAGSRRNERASLSMMATEWPALVSSTASPEPTLPQPMTMTCMGLSNTLASSGTTHGPFPFDEIGDSRPRQDLEAISGCPESTKYARWSCRTDRPTCRAVTPQKTLSGR